MKNKKGFTLIELLAVIVILAIIALIVTPVVSNIVANARIAANARSVEGHIRNIELAIITKAFGENSTGDLDSFDTITSGATIESSLSRPGNDNVTCTSYTIKHGTVLSASGCKDSDNKWGEKYSYNNSEGAYVFQFNGIYVAAQVGETHKGIVYMDPTNVKTVCNENSDLNVTTRDIKSGCMKFYIYDDNGDTYKMILDRNTTANGVAWINEQDYIKNGGIKTDWDAGKYTYLNRGFTAEKQLSDDTLNWNNTGKVDLISADEIAKIVDNVSWTSTTAASNNNFFFGSKNRTNYSNQSVEEKAVQQSYHWLYDYTYECVSYGCKVSLGGVNGYWTKNKVSNSDSLAWYVSSAGYLANYNNFGDNATRTSRGIRPVLEVPKSLIG